MGAAAGRRADRPRAVTTSKFTLPDLDGYPHTLSEYRDENTNLNIDAIGKEFSKEIWNWTETGFQYYLPLPDK